MEPIHRRLISFLFAVCLASAAFAQGWQPHQTAPNADTAVPANGPSLTERMGRKWMDEQNRQLQRADRQARDRATIQHLARTFRRDDQRRRCNGAAAPVRDTTTPTS